VLGVVLMVRGQVRLPTGWALWAVLAALMALSFLRLDGNGLVGFVLRFGFVVAAFLVYLYVYNAARSGVSWQALFHPLCLFWLTVVAPGWLAVIAPKLSLTTPVEMLLPGSISGERMVQALTHLKATEHNPLSRNPYYRTAAPYPYTNNWGTGFAVMVPCVLAYVTSFRTGGCGGRCSCRCRWRWCRRSSPSTAACSWGWASACATSACAPWSAATCGSSPPSGRWRCWPSW
jgi:hypothetical protein